MDFYPVILSHQYSPWYHMKQAFLPMSIPPRDSTRPHTSEISCQMRRYPQAFHPALPFQHPRPSGPVPSSDYQMIEPDPSADCPSPDSHTASPPRLYISASLSPSRPRK